MIDSSSTLLSHARFLHRFLNGVIRPILYIIIIDDELLRGPGFGILFIVINSSIILGL